MFKLRISIAVLCVLTSLICVLLAKPKPLTKKQQEEKQACDNVFDICFQGCGTVTINPLHPNITTGTNECQNYCIEDLARCYKKIGISAAPKSRLPQGTTLQPLTTPTPTPRGSVRQPQGTLTQASPTATPARLVRQPQGNLTQASPSASPTKIFKETKKEKKK